MKSKQTMFFMTLNDFKEIGENVESLFSIRYYKMGLLDSNIVPSYNSIFQSPNLGYPEFGDWNYNDDFLIMPNNCQLNIREVPQRKGGLKYAVDQRINPISITLNLGGVYSEKDKIIVAGRVTTISDDSFSNEIYKVITAKIKKQFKQIDGFYVGKEAMEKLKEGWRLVTNEKLDKGFDLKIT